MKVKIDSFQKLACFEVDGEGVTVNIPEDFEQLYPCVCLDARDDVVEISLAL